MGGGTEAFPDLGSHCQRSDCRQLDFLPFTCKACQKNIAPTSHTHVQTLKSTFCSTAIETTGHIGDSEKKLLERHEKSGDCDPKKKKKPTCPVRRCKEELTFSNTTECKKCRVKVCLKHRFPADHTCGKLNSGSGSGSSNGSKFLATMATRSGKDCGEKIIDSKSRSVNVY